ncbi:MAG: class I SAM-dependent RNA methyltransferase [Eubacteriales bacterium]|uniref:THUMP domain-containing class I SAM-dependent RNA methyltransferase n=1 Tax=Fenollaria sp. TaxID=1965292 RepID=UPI002A75D31B|nr:class I SAM-dependent RNA methyltransferase [Fenollaria sp.]MDD7339196.1 class I SAM-dependent RNA methyltransferase [Eubacteriales bacterium]MDY3106192.1 class I SAM-dependent RNA methyltransferase [Fenollaria sp.]
MYELIATSSFGLEAIVKRELNDLGLEVTKTDNGHIYFNGDAIDIARANINLRCADRVLINLKSFKAESFEELFDGIYELPWNDILDEDSNFIVEGRSHKSNLFSISDCQRITEKAIIKKLQMKHDISRFTKSSHRHRLEISLLNDIASITLDTSGDSLHKRGYRDKQGAAPLKETMAAALVKLSFYNKDRPFFDPFCGSGTIPIEALLIARNIAPGLDRDFDSMNFKFIDADLFKKARMEAMEKIDYKSKVYIDASDISHKSIAIAKYNLENLGLSDDIRFFVKDFRDVDIKNNYGVMITNPPYGKRLEEDNLRSLYSDFGKKIKNLDTWSIYVLTSYEEIERDFSRKADKNRKLYNGSLKTYYYQFYGKKPEK